MSSEAPVSGHQSGGTLDEREAAFADLRGASDEAGYRARFADVQFGLAAAHAIARRQALAGQPIRRQVAGSNLVFRVGVERWIKIAPPFWSASFEVEIAMLRRVDGRLGVETPRLHAHGAIGAWRYAVLAHVRGRQWRAVRSLLSAAHRTRIASELGSACQALHVGCSHGHELRVDEFHRQLLERAENAERIQRARGATEAQGRAIADFLARHRNVLAPIDDYCMVHADLTDEHVLVRRRRDGPRLCGIIDFADAQPAPRAYEFVLPFIQLFPEDGAAQRAFLGATGYPRGEWSSLPTLLMALALSYRFLAFHDWFRPWLTGGTPDLDAIARRVFPLCAERPSPLHRRAD